MGYLVPTLHSSSQKFLKSPKPRLETLSSTRHVCPRRTRSCPNIRGMTYVVTNFHMRCCDRPSRRALYTIFMAVQALRSTKSRAGSQPAATPRRRWLFSTCCNVTSPNSSSLAQALPMSALFCSLRVISHLLKCHVVRPRQVFRRCCR